MALAVASVVLRSQKRSLLSPLGIRRFTILSVENSLDSDKLFCVARFLAVPCRSCLRRHISTSRPVIFVPEKFSQKSSQELLAQHMRTREQFSFGPSGHSRITIDKDAVAGHVISCCSNYSTSNSSGSSRNGPSSTGTSPTSSSTTGSSLTGSAPTGSAPAGIPGSNATSNAAPSPARTASKEANASIIDSQVTNIIDIAAAAAVASDKVTKEPASKIIVKVSPAPKKQKEKTDFSQSYTANIYIPAMRAMHEYLLESSELDSLPKYTRRSPYPERDNITVFKRWDLEQRVIEKWGSMENLQLQKDLRKVRENEAYAQMFQLRMAQREYKREHSDSASTEKPFIVSPTDKGGSGLAGGGPSEQSIFRHGSGQVVLYAIAVNAANCVIKFAAWLYTGSHSMFSEFIHSLADTANQLILAIGIRQSLKKPDLEHPYGWASFRNVSSLISGVGIFCVGAGLSYYHGIMGLIHGVEIESWGWALTTLAGSFLSEGATLMVAINEVRRGAITQKMNLYDYVMHGRDPSTNVVMLEDLAAVGGVTIAAACISLTHYTGNSIYDAMGSIFIGTILAGVASLIIYTNTQALVGRSIPLQKRLELMRELESDRMVRTIHDVKATDVGGRFVKFKAEVDFDGKEITRLYLEQHDLEKLFQEIRAIATLEDTEAFMLKHGENIIDSLGGEVDRIERNLKRKHPEIRHCDLEQL